MHRKKIPTGIKLRACLYLLGFTDEDKIEWDHNPPLALREIVDGAMIPDANDPKYIRPMRKTDHAIKTNGKPATTYGSDKHQIAKAKRLSKEQKEFRAKLLAKDNGEKQPEPKKWKRKWPTNKLRTGFWQS